jgi:hypothetical protein
MVRVEILLSVTLAAVGAYLLIGVIRGPGRRGPGGAPESAAAPATCLQAARRPPNPLPVTPLPVPDLPVRRSRPAPAPATRCGVNNNRFARFDHSGRPASMASPYLRTERPASR